MNPPNPTRRNPETHQAILSAALELLLEHGYAKLSIEAIAAKAGVGKQSIYRWWNSKAAVILEAYAGQAEKNASPLNSKNPKADMLEYLNRTAIAFQDAGGRAARSLIAEASINPEFRAALWQELLETRRQHLRGLLERVAPNANHDLLIDMIYGTIWYRLQLEHAPLNKKFLSEMLELLL